MSGADERELVIAAMRMASRDMAPVDVERLARILVLPIGAIPVDLVVAQSRETRSGSSAIDASADLIAGSADPALWTRELLSRGDLTPDVIAIAIAICARAYPDHPLATLSPASVRFARAIYDLHLLDGGVCSLDLRAAPAAERLILLDRADPLASWIWMEAREDADDTGTRPSLKTRASAGRFQALLEQGAAAPETYPLYVGPAVAIASHGGELANELA